MHEVFHAIWPDPIGSVLPWAFSYAVYRFFQWLARFQRTRVVATVVPHQPASNAGSSQLLNLPAVKMAMTRTGVPTTLPSDAGAASTGLPMAWLLVTPLAVVATALKWIERQGADLGKIELALFAGVIGAIAYYVAGVSVASAHGLTIDSYFRAHLIDGPSATAFVSVGWLAVKAGQRVAGAYFLAVGPLILASAAYVAGGTGHDVLDAAVWGAFLGLVFGLELARRLKPAPAG